MRPPRLSLAVGLFALVVACGTSACASSSTSYAGATALATVNGEPLSEAAFAQFVSVKLGAFAEEKLNDTVQSELLDEFVKRQLAVQAATDRGMEPVSLASSTGPDGDRVLQEQAIDSLVDRYYREVVLKDVAVSPDEVASYYASHRQSYADDGVVVREILVKTRGEAERALASVESGCDFAEVAKSVSSSPTAKSGGLAYYDPSCLPPPFASVIAPLGDGQMSGVVHTDLGYHLFRVEHRRHDDSFDRVRDRVTGDVLARKNERLVEADMERLLVGARVKINRAQLPFQYEGRFAQ